MRKNIFIVSLVICITTILLSGCGRDLNKRTFVEFMGLEKQSGIYKVSLRLYSPIDNENASETNSENSFERLLSGEGITIREALRNAELIHGKELFLGHIKMLILGGGLTTPASEMKFLFDEGVSPGCPVAKADFTENIMTIFEQDNSDELLETFESSARNGKTVYTSLVKLSENNTALNLPVVLPVLTTNGFDGLTFCQNNFAIENAENIHSNDVLGVRLLLDDYSTKDKAVISVSAGGHNAAVLLENAKTSKKAYIDGEGILHISAVIKVKFRINENPFDIAEKDIENAVLLNLNDAIVSAYSTAVWYNKKDVFDIYKLLRKNSPEAVRSYLENSSDLLENSVLDVRIINTK